ncbi:MAG: NAD-dependent epimerase/dehydratase family protein [Candidatus Ranarchaeia archaeon]
MPDASISILVTGGAGQLGAAVVRQLIYQPKIKEIIIADQDEEAGRRLTYNARSIGLMIRNSPDIRFLTHDLTDLDATVDILKTSQPDIIIHTATLLSSYYYLPILRMTGAHNGFNDPLPGHTVAKDLALTYTLMKAVKSADLAESPYIINASFPDNVNYILGKIGLAPTIGAGNVDVLVYMIRILIADQIGVQPSQVQLNMVAHHALENHPESTTPFYLQVFIAGKDRTAEFDSVKLVQKAVHSVLLWGKGITLLNENTAANIIKNVWAFVDDWGSIEYIPGPNGLPGGYPVRIGKNDVEVVLPDNITLEEAIEINKRGMYLDGIQDVLADGTVIFSDPAIHLMRNLLGINWKRCTPDEAMAMSRDLRAAYHRLAESL